MLLDWVTFGHLDHELLSCFSLRLSIMESQLCGVYNTCWKAAVFTAAARVGSIWCTATFEPGGITAAVTWLMGPMLPAWFRWSTDADSPPLESSIPIILL